MPQEYTKLFEDMRSLYSGDISHIDVKAELLEEERRQINEYKKVKLDPVGQEDGDIDNDGDEDETDKYLLGRRAVRGKAIKQRLKSLRKHRRHHKKGRKNHKRVHENYIVDYEPLYDWRSTIDEDIQAAIDDLEADQIVEKPVNNYVKTKNGKPVVTINPTLNIKEEVEEMGGQVVYLNEDSYLLEDVIDVVSERFYQEGYSSYDVEDLIEELGEDGFAEYAFDIFEDCVLSEARAGGSRIEPVTTKGTPFKKTKTNPKGIPTGKSLRRLQSLKAERRANEEEFSSKKPSGLTAALRSQSAQVAAAKTPSVASLPPAREPQPSRRQRRPSDPWAGSVNRPITPRVTTQSTRALPPARGRAIAALPPAREPQSSRHETALGRLQNAAQGKIGTEVRIAPPAKSATSSTPKPQGRLAQVMEKGRKDIETTKQLVGQTLQAAQKAGKVAKEFGTGAAAGIEDARRAMGLETQTGRNLQALLIKGGRRGLRAARDVVAKELARHRAGIKEDFVIWLDSIIDEGYDIADYTMSELYEEYEYLYEKAVSEQQQKIFGLALSVKRGDTPRSEVSKQVLDIVDSMSEAEIRKFAKTGHKGIPTKVDEEITYDDILYFMSK